MQETIAILMFPELGALNASFQLANELKKTGFNILYLGTPKYQEYIEQQGFHYRTFELDVFYSYLLDKQAEIKNANINFLHKAHRYLKLILERNIELEKFLLKEFLWLDREEIQLLLMDPLLFGCSIPFLKRSIRIVHLNTTFAYKIDFNNPPVFSKLIRKQKKDFFQNIRFFISWCYFFMRAIFRDLHWHWIYGIKPTRTINTPRKMIKKHGGHYIWGEYGFRLKTQEMVLASARHEFAHYFDTSKIYAGSSIFNNRKGFEPVDLNFSNKPILYCSLGSYSHIWFEQNIQVFNTIIEAMKDRNSWEVMIQVGEIDHYDRMDLPDHIHIYKFVQQLKVLEKASLAVTHVGCSSYKECTFTGTPMIMLPWNNDGYGNAARALSHNLGILLDIKKFTCKRFINALETIQENSGIHQSVLEFQKQLLIENDCKAGVQYIRDQIKNNKNVYQD